MAEPLELQSHDILRSICRIMEKQTLALTALWCLCEKLKERLTNVLQKRTLQAKLKYVNSFMDVKLTNL